MFSRKAIQDYLKVKFRANKGFIIFILFVFIPIRSAIADWNYVPTGSMNPTIMEGDMVFINKAAYDLRFPLTMKRIAKWGNPKVGDVVVLFSPKDDIRVVKRIIAQPGDKIAMYNNIVFKNGKPLTYEEIPKEQIKEVSKQLSQFGNFYYEQLEEVKHAITSIPHISGNKSFQEISIPEGHYFVMGDNRDNSKDSRSYGLVERDTIIGKACAVIGSLNIKDMYQPRFSRFFKPIN